MGENLVNDSEMCEELQIDDRKYQGLNGLKVRDDYAQNEVVFAILHVKKP
jgi:hypothetical protein